MILSLSWRWLMNLLIRWHINRTLIDLIEFEFNCQMIGLTKLIESFQRKKKDWNQFNLMLSDIGSIISGEIEWNLFDLWDFCFIFSSKFECNIINEIDLLGTEFDSFYLVIFGFFCHILVFILYIFLFICFHRLITLF